VHGVPALTDQVGLVGLDPVDGVAVLVGEDRDGAGAQLVGRAEGPDGDLPTVRDQDLAEHGASHGWTDGTGATLRGLTVTGARAH